MKRHHLLILSVLIVLLAMAFGCGKQQATSEAPTTVEATKTGEDTYVLKFSNGSVPDTAIYSMESVPDTASAAEGGQLVASPSTITFTKK